MENLPENAGIIGVGVDIVEVKRFTEKVNNDKFLNKVFTENELIEVGNSRHRVESLAARWAAKEAVGKALGIGIGTKLRFKQVEVLKEANGKPFIQLSGELSDFKNLDIFLSLSHDGGMAIAFVVITRK